VSGTVSFRPEEWYDRFDIGTYTPALLLTLRRRGSEVPPSHCRAVEETVKKAAKRPLRFAVTSTSWETDSPLGPELLELGITAYDWQETDGDLGLPSSDGIALPVEFADDTERRSVQLRPTFVAAHILHERFDSSVRVHVEGTAELGSTLHLCADRLSDLGYGDDYEVFLEDECPFETSAPMLEIEVLDDTGFVLDRREVRLGDVPVSAEGSAPGRPPRWIARVGDPLDTYAGEPAGVVVRIVDPD
jgi:hypothetical protein